MLLFIICCYHWFEYKIIFQNILCYCLSAITVIFASNTIISKHLMLLFIVILDQLACCLSIISKHLMLLFIRLISAFMSPCTIISKHLMLLFINIFHRYYLSSVISKHLMLLFIAVTLPSVLVPFSDFKTSYVIVYHNTDFGSDSLYAFQNILCYCLSLRFKRFSAYA